MKFRFAHNNLNVLDLERSLAFYEEALGLQEVRRKEAADGSFTLIPTGDVVAGAKKVTVSFSDTHKTVSMSLKVTAKAPAIVAKPASVTLNSTAGDSARIPITASPADYRIPEAKLFLTDSKGNKLEQQDLLNYSYENGVVTAVSYTHLRAHET